MHIFSKEDNSKDGVLLEQIFPWNFVQLKPIYWQIGYLVGNKWSNEKYNSKYKSLFWMVIFLISSQSEELSLS